MLPLPWQAFHALDCIVSWQASHELDNDKPLAHWIKANLSCIRSWKAFHALDHDVLNHMCRSLVLPYSPRDCGRGGSKKAFGRILSVLPCTWSAAPALSSARGHGFRSFPFRFCAEGTIMVPPSPRTGWRTVHGRYDRNWPGVGHE